jgi:uncharacterized membrane protein
MSVYAANTDLMGVVNDSAAVDGRIERVIALAGAAPPGPDVIQVSSPRGLAIFRTLVPDLEHSQDIDSIRRLAAGTARRAKSPSHPSTWTRLRT